MLVYKPQTALLASYKPLRSVWLRVQDPGTKKRYKKDPKWIVYTSEFSRGFRCESKEEVCLYVITYTHGRSHFYSLNIFLLLLRSLFQSFLIRCTSRNSKIVVRSFSAVTGLLGLLLYLDIINTTTSYFIKCLTSERFGGGPSLIHSDSTVHRLILPTISLGNAVMGRKGVINSHLHCRSCCCRQRRTTAGHIFIVEGWKSRREVNSQYSSTGSFLDA